MLYSALRGCLKVPPTSETRKAANNYTMEISEVLHVTTREDWRHWLEEQHANAREIWLVSYKRATGKPSLPYIEAVEEALCFGWIDSTGKRIDEERTALRYTPRRPKSSWTELNKERARRLIASGRMTPAGMAVLPDLSPQPFHTPEDIQAALQADPLVWENYQRFPNGYQRMRVTSIEEARNQPEVFRRRLDAFIQKTRENKMYGWIEDNPNP